MNENDVLIEMIKEFTEAFNKEQKQEFIKDLDKLIKKYVLKYEN